MLRGLYFMGWYRDMWNYHPSLPIKNMHMIEDIVDINANTLIWSCLGSGAIGLPYLDREANDPTPPRLRLYGFMNDKEFCHECAKRGITVFSVLWKAQLWEFGAELNEDESELLALNILRGASKNKKYVGMSELSTNKYPKLFNPMDKYFPDGLLDYKGNKVTDFLDEFRAVSLEGRNILSAWLMAPEHDHKCYSPCSAKKSYLSYMKRDTEMMSDAGAGGLHIDEYDTQKHVLQNAGCFCNECVDNFRLYIAEHHIPLPADAGDIANFNYRQYLLGKGYKDKDLVGCNGNERWKIPLFRAFTDMQMASIEMVVRELSAHIKEYSLRTRGQAMKVTANLFQCYPFSWNCKKHLDILAGEKTQIQLRQDGWYKFAFGWLNGKESCFVEDPNQYVRDMLRDIKNNIHDRFILFALEPMAHGFHIAFPYGSWLQNQEKDAFWPDLRILKQLGNWLDSHENLFPKNPVADIAVIYDALSANENFLMEPTDHTVVKVEFAPGEELGKQGAFGTSGDFGNFFNLVQKLSEKNVLYNVIYVSPDEPLTAERLSQYKKIIVPEAFMLSDDAAAALLNHGKNDNEVITLARTVKKLAGYKNVPSNEMNQLVESLSDKKGIISTHECDKVGVAVHQNKNGYVLHVINYNYNEGTHRIDPVNITFDLGFQCKQVKIHSFPENQLISYSLSTNHLELKNAGIYTVVEF
ncbi:MAG TPA: hypothetical protein DDW65_05335 [Firmicutes bacterium]|nr:hypothetical protein [Bacillota bacterium]